MSPDDIAPSVAARRSSEPMRLRGPCPAGRCRDRVAIPNPTDLGWFDCRAAEMHHARNRMAGSRRLRYRVEMQVLFAGDWRHA